MPSGGNNLKYEFNQAIADEICDAVAVNPYSLKKICRLFPEFPPPYAIYRWFEKHPDFREKFTRAKDSQVETYVEEMLAELEESDKYSYIDKEGNKRLDTGAVNFARLKIDSIKWYAGKLKAKKYGDEKADDSQEVKRSVTINKVIMQK
jgi:hypothetical protein